MMIKTGVTLANRYEIIGRIGSGGMAEVFKATDHKLNRNVAVKVMKPEFQGDSTFVSKFRREAQAAAGLANPNIVNVYDVGEDKGCYYIVMELVEGITLKEYIEKKGKLSVREATSIAIQVSMGLAAAHDQGIVHRDIKPQNIMISTDGKVKVTDFGIARAASSNTISSNSMVSVHYSSPEQVRGGFSDARSDIYSLGITLYEMVTGRVPFDGETSVAIAIKHLQDEMEPPTKYTPDLPHALEQIIYKCTQKSVDRRYQSMNEVIADLKRSLLEPSGNFVEIMPLTDSNPTRVISESEKKEIRSGGIVERSEGGQTFSSIDAARRGKNDDEEDLVFDDDDEPASALEKAVTIGSFIVCGLIIFILIFFIAKAAGLFGNSRTESGGTAMVTSGASNASGTGSLAASATSEASASTASTASSDTISQVTSISVPTVLGLTEAEARKIADDKSLELKFMGEKYSDQAEGTIIEQDPPAGTMVDKGAVINYYKSSGPEMKVVPEVTGIHVNDARKALAAEGFTNIRVEKQTSDSNPVGRILGVTPAEGENVAVDTEITLQMCKGSSDSATVRITDYVGMSESEAYKDARDSGLIVNVTYDSSDDFGQDDVISQSLEANSSVEMGTDIILVVNNAEKAAEQAEDAAAQAALAAVASTASQTSAGTDDAAQTDAGAAAAAGTASAPEVTAPVMGDPWKAAANLLSTDLYTGGPYRLVLEQTVNGVKTETVVEESNTSLEFPHMLEVEGVNGVADGQVVLYEKQDDETYKALVAWALKFS